MTDNLTTNPTEEPAQNSGEPCLCYHCQLPVTTGDQYSLAIAGKDQPMCCPGCVAAAKMIVANNLGHYYDYRQICAEQPKAADPVTNAQARHREYQVWAKPEFMARYCRQTAQGMEAELIISGIHCAACVWLLEKYLANVTGITHVLVNLASHRCYLRFDPEQCNFTELFSNIAQLGYQPFPYVASVEEQVFQQEKRSMLKALGISAIAVMQVMMYTIALYAGAFEGIEPVYQSLLRWSSLVILTPVVLYSARLFYINAWRDLRNGRAGMDLPVSLAIIAGYGASVLHTVWRDGEVYFESVSMFVFFLLLSRYIELNARRQQTMSTNQLVSVFPDYALKITPQGHETVLLNELVKGDLVLVENGATIPTDGFIVTGSTLIDESAFSGESLPLTKQQGEQVFAGSINVQNPIELRVDSLPEQSMLSNMVRLAERAAADKPALAVLADQVAGYFVTLVLLCAATAWVYWHFTAPDSALAVLLAVLVVSCPCALSLATPVALAVGNKTLLQQGLMPTTGQLLTGLAEVDTVVFDKTGTLTDGRIDLVNIEPMAELGSEQLLALAGAMEMGINHPLAKVLVDKANALDDEQRQIGLIEAIEVVQGGGVLANYKGQQLALGSSEFVCQSLKLAFPLPPRHQHAALRVWLCSENGPLGYFEFKDSPKVDAKLVIDKLHDMGLGVHLISGDGEENCAAVCKQLNITQFQSVMKPHDKIAYLDQLVARGKKVLMVGDGINDAAALKQAHVSIAIDSASEFVQAKTDGVMLNRSLTPLIDGLALAQNNRKIIRQNIAWALLYNLSALPLAANGMIPPWLAALGMSMSSLLVILNSWRLGFYRQRLKRGHSV